MRRLALVMMVAGCGSDAAARRETGGRVEPARSDSAGVELLVHDAAGFAAAPGITLDSTPLAVIEGSAEDETADISTIVPSLFLPDGRLLGIDRQRQVLVLFSADGSTRQEFGRQGSGPGEYGGIGSILPVGDGRYLVMDFRNGRISFFDPEAGPGRELPISDAMGMGTTSPVAMVNGKILLWGSIFGGAGSTAPPGLKTAVLDTLTGTTERLFSTAAEDPEAGPRMIQLPGGGRAMVAMDRMAGPMLTAFPSAFGWDGALVATDPNRFQFTWHDTTGAVTRILRVQRPRVAVTEQVWQDYISDFIDQITGVSAGPGGVAMAVMGGGAPDTAQIRQQMSSQEYADSLPAFDRTRLAPDGILWVLDYRVPRQDGWAATAIDREGRILGRVAEATGNAPVAIGNDRMAFRTEDDLGIATITVRRIVMP
jgi:hypothetical protein